MCQEVLGGNDRYHYVPKELNTQHSALSPSKLPFANSSQLPGDVAFGSRVKSGPFEGRVKMNVNEQAVYARSLLGDAARSPARARAVLG